jgi:serine/threonine-protein kinase
VTNPSARLTAALSDRYTIERELGQGGMATVYLAHDVRHDRRVAVKVLRPELAAVIGAERFLSEIKTTANLQHPHILPLFDSGESDGFLFYVMPYVEGETVRDRIHREKQLPVADAVRIATEVAGALDYAHRHNVIHRDIKPENILLHDGSALVADFGIALAASKAGGTRMTETGMSLGTPHYMSPEQAMGEREITARSDVYALGCVLYEMLTGDPPFTGSTAQAIVARVVTEAPRPLAPQRHTIPPHVEAAVLTALEKLPADRFATAAEFAEALTDPGYAPRTTVAMAAVAGPATAIWKRRFMMAVAVAGIATAGAAWGWLREHGLAGQAADWQYISLGDSVVTTLTAPSLALSPDGNTLVVKDNVQNGLLWVKRGAALDPIAIPGTERANNPAFSPDGEWVVFVADQRLRKVRPSSGAAVTLVDSAAGGFGGAAWLDDGTIIFVSPDLSKLLRVNASGGTGEVVLNNTGLQGLGFGYPTALPGARGVLFQACSSGCVTMSLRVLDLRTGTQKLLINEVAQAWYLPGGRLLYTRRDGSALVAPFDLGRLEVTGPAVPVLDHVLVFNGFAQLTVSASGTLVYATGESPNNENTIMRVARSGATTPVDSAWAGRITSLAISPDGRRLAVGMGAGTGGLNIWIKQLDRGPLTRLSFGGGDRRPVWSPDGRMVAFIRDTLNTSIVAGRFVDGSRPDTVLFRFHKQIQEVDWSRDGRWLVGRTDNGTEGAGDLVGVRVGGDTTAVVLVGSPFTELEPAVAPDGRWLAYASNESGRNEVYVRPFPNTGDGRWQVSTAGGAQPRWAPDGRELFYLDASSRMVAARVTADPVFAVTELRPLFDASGFTLDAFHQSYDVTPDGRNFIFPSPRQLSAAARAPSLVRVEHWFRDLETKLSE